MIASRAKVVALSPDAVAALRARLEPLVAESVAGLETGGKPAKALLEEYRR